jgi:hypothetical protein
VRMQCCTGEHLFSYATFVCVFCEKYPESKHLKVYYTTWLMSCVDELEYSSSLGSALEN